MGSEPKVHDAWKPGDLQTICGNTGVIRALRPEAVTCGVCKRARLAWEKSERKLSRRSRIRPKARGQVRQ